MKNTSRTTSGALYAVQKLCLCALLCAMSVVLGYLAKLIFGTSPLRLTFENLPIIFSGIAFGPLSGALVGVTADLVNCLFAGQGPAPLITVAAGGVGLLSGLLSYLPPLRKPTFPTLLVIEGITHMLASVILKSVALHIYYTYPYLVLLPRLPIYIGIAIAESYGLYILLNHKTIKRYFKKEKEKETEKDTKQA